MMTTATHLVAESVWNDIESTRSVTDKHLDSLNFLFGKNMESAARIVDLKGVKKISGELSGRTIFQVTGESKRKEEYFCFPEHYCSCQSFFYDIVKNGKQLFCKHQIAARLASSAGLCIDVKVSDEQLAVLLSNV
ncbi:zinc finger SWIM domain-containing protein 7 [Heracleum sosnowskyi]|uniref:Zinc finger SWIM domain-containing protein 7 n=1 Tax=Heracleum sosnowskyi TaxID=360622 RepID=A0AAD8N3D9_9APIA|nr:zinc finger SWIM domain-containing protein 7 [Heracleum sosnowskyi]